MIPPKLPPLTKELEDHLSWYSDPKADRIRAMIRDYATAAIKAQGVPMEADFDQLRAMQAEWHAVSHDDSITSEAKFQRVYKAAMRACATPAPQAKQCEWTNCPTRVGNKCCNEQASVVQQEPFGCVTVVRKLGHADTYHFYPHPQSPYLDNASECHTLYTHPAQQDKPQPLLSSEIWDNDAIMEVNADAQLHYELIERFVRSIEAAHGIEGVNMKTIEQMNTVASNSISMTQPEMTKWTVRPSSIAAVAYIDGVETGTYVAVYLSEDKTEVTGAGSTRVKYNLQDADFIPSEVRTAVQEHFDHVFALEHGNEHPSPRAIYMQTVKPITVLVP